jgi:geranylgeranyl diphosphate synthase type II
LDIYTLYDEQIPPPLQTTATEGDVYAPAGMGCPATLQQAIRHSLLAPAKRLRPMLVLMAAEACGCRKEQALPAACAVEMIHTYSLIHDDLPAMDDDDLRRGLPTCHAKFGEATAILAGDALLAQAFETLARDIRPAAAAARCCAELGSAAGPKALVGGQADDLAAEFGVGEIEQLESIHRRKTGALFVAAVRLGGHVAQATTQQLSALTLYAQSLGLAFQIVDDLLDLKGDVTAMGKRTQKDVDRGKLTFPRILGLESSRHRAQRLISEAIAALQPLAPSASSLEALAQYVLERTQ